MSGQAFVPGVRKRDPLFDNMKAILIFLVVLGHSISSFNDPGGYWYDWLYQVIFSFHMPVFLFVSGYFAAPRPKRTIARLLPLYLVFQVVHLLLGYVENWLENPQEARLNFQIFDPQWTLWYLMVLMIYGLVLPVLDVDDPRKQIRNLAAAFICGLLIGLNDETHNFMDVSRAISFLPFYLLGYYGKKNQALSRILSRGRCGPLQFSAAAGAAALLIWFAMPGCPFRGEMFYGTMSYRVDGFTVGVKILTYLVGCAWILILLLLVPARQLPLLGRMGRNTLGVYLFHTVALRLLRGNPAINGVFNQSLPLVLLLAAGLTLLFSLDIFSDLLRKIQEVHVLHINKKTEEKDRSGGPSSPENRSFPQDAAPVSGPCRPAEANPESF